MFDIDNNWNIIENEHKVYPIDIEDNFDECYYTILKDPKQLEDVFKYYDQKHIK